MPEKMVRWRPFSVYYTTPNGQLLVHMAGRSEDGKRVKVTVKGTRPYFYVPAGEGRVNEVVTEVVPNALKSLGGPWGPSQWVDKVFVRYPFEVPRIREQYSNHWEADVIYERRVRYDLGIRECIETPEGKTLIDASEVRPSPGKTIEPRTCTLDIETFDSLDSKNTPVPVVAIAVHDSKVGAYSGLYGGLLPMPEEVTAWFVKKGVKGKVHVLPTEYELFAAFTQYINTTQPDVLNGWNSIGFDYGYLKNRAQSKGYYAPEWREHEHFDSMEAYSFMVDQKGGNWRGLDEAAKECGLDGKTTKLSIRKMIEMEIPHELVIYNVNDVKLTVEIAAMKKLVSFFARLAGLAGCSIGDCFNETELSLGRLAEAFAFHEANGKWALPSKNRERVAKYWYPIVGAVAIPPVAGQHSPVEEWDNSTEYVATVRTLNLSPDTLVRDEYDGPCFQLPSGRRYRKDIRGFFPSCLDKLAQLRVQTKKDIDDGVPGAKDADAVAKSLSNTFAYGWPSSPAGRLGCPDYGNDITDVARRHLLWNRDFIAAEGNPVYGGFTDGVFFGPQPGWDGVDALARLNKSLDQFAAQFGAETHLFAVKKEHRYISGIIRASEGNTRGSYAMVYESASGKFERGGKRYDMKVRGFEERRGDSAPITKELQKEVLFMAAFGEDVTKYLRGIVEGMQNGTMDPAKVRYAKRLTADMQTKGNLQHVRAAKWSNQHLGTKFTQGSKAFIHFGYVQGLPKTDVFALGWDDPLPPGAVINWEQTIQRVVIGPLEEVLDLLGIPAQAILANNADAEEFF